MQKNKKQEGGQHFFTPLYIYIYIYTKISVTQNRRDSFSWVKKKKKQSHEKKYLFYKLAVSYEFVGGGRDFGLWSLARLRSCYISVLCRH